MENCADAVVTSRLIVNSERSDIPFLIFGIQWAFSLEPYIYQISDVTSKDYDGGYWKMASLSNDGFFMYPSTEQVFDVYVETNGFSGRLSAEAFGIVVCLFAFNWTSFQIRHSKLSPVVVTDISELFKPLPAGLSEFCDSCDLMYEKLIEYARVHPEADLIFHAID